MADIPSRILKTTMRPGGLEKEGVLTYLQELNDKIESLENELKERDEAGEMQESGLIKEYKRDLEAAEKAQASIASFRAVFKYGNPNTIVKKAAALLGYPVGDCRRPFNRLCDEGLEELKKVMKENREKGMD